MKKVLLLNGSPRGTQSNTRRLALAFLDGLNYDHTLECQEILCAQVKVGDCRGCFTCWKTDEGRCALQDDMTDILRKYIEADLVIWSFPDYFCGMPSGAKRIMDRLLPLFYQNLETRDKETTQHLRRVDLSRQKYLLFCSAGLYNTKQNTEAIQTQFRLLYGERCEMLFCPEGQLLSNEHLQYLTSPYLQALYDAGRDYRETLHLNEGLYKTFQKPFLPMQDFLAYVDSAALRKRSDMSSREYQQKKIQAYFRNMARTFDPSVLHVERAVLEICLSDHDYRCQLHLTKTECTHIDTVEDFEPYTLRINAPLSFYDRRPSEEKKSRKGGFAPEINQLVILADKYAAKGISKEMHFR